MNLFVYPALYIVLAIVAYIDHCTYRIPNAAILMILVLAIITTLIGECIYPFSSIGLSIFLSLLPRVSSFLFRRPISFGWGDVKLMGACALFISMDDMGRFLMGVGLFSLLYPWVFRKNPIPFAPAIGAAFFMVTTFGRTFLSFL